jgi:hypothetical protein
MATCPRCLGALTEGHKCRPVWIRRLRRQAGFALLGTLFGAFIQILTMPGVPVLGPILGGLLFFSLHEALKPE